jgi:exopolysaccharide production protein ExoQ
LAYLALFITLLFIPWLLFRDLRRRPALSNLLWIPTCFVLILGSRPLSYWLYGVSTSPVNEAFYVLFLGVCFWIATSRGVKWGRLLARNLPLVLIYAYFALSVFWSGDPSGSAKRVIKDFGLLFVISAILSETDGLEALRAVFFRCAAVLFPLSLLFDRYFPNISRQYTVEGEILLTGVTTQKNTLGEIVFVFSIFILWDLMERHETGKRFLTRKTTDHILLLVIGVLLLYQCQSKTSLLCLLIGGALSVRPRWLSSRMSSRIVFYGIIASPFLLFFTQEFGEIIRPIVQAMGRDMTFTGRAEIWAHIHLRTVNPIVGSGFWNFWGGPGGQAIVDEMKTPIPNAHNGYIDIYLDGGIVGLGLLLLLLVRYGRRIINHSRKSGFQNVRFAILSTAIIYNLSESSFFRVGLLWFTTLTILVGLPSMKGAQRIGLRKAKLDERANSEEIEATV